MAERPIYGVVFNPKGVRWNFGDPLAAGDLPSDMKIGRRVAWGKFKLEAHYPNVNPGIDEAGLKHTEVKKGNYDTRKAAQDAFKSMWKGVKWTAATKKAYIDRRVADGSFCRYYEDNSPYFLARTVWDSGVMPGVHLMTKTKDGRTVRFAVAPSSKSKNSITLIGSMVVPLADDPDGGAILCSGPVATLTAKGDDNEFKLDKWDKHGIECPKTYKPEEDEPAVQIDDQVPPKYRYKKKELKESRKWKGLEWCPPDERLDYSYNQQATNYKEAEGNGTGQDASIWIDCSGSTALPFGHKTTLLEAFILNAALALNGLREMRAVDKVEIIFFATTAKRFTFDSTDEAVEWLLLSESEGGPSRTFGGGTNIRMAQDLARYWPFRMIFTDGQLSLGGHSAVTKNAETFSAAEGSQLEKLFGRVKRALEKEFGEGNVGVSEYGDGYDPRNRHEYDFGMFIDGLDSEDDDYEKNWEKAQNIMGPYGFDITADDGEHGFGVINLEQMLKNIGYGAETFNAISNHRNRKGHFTGHQSVHNNDTGQFMPQGAEDYNAEDEITVDEMNERVQNLGSKTYFEFCYRFDIDPEDAQEMSWFIADHHDAPKVISWLKDNADKYDAESFESQSAGDQLISWEEDGYSSASMPPSNVHFGADTTTASQKDIKENWKRHELMVKEGIEGQKQSWGAKWPQQEKRLIEAGYLPPKGYTDSREDYEKGFHWGFKHGMKNDLAMNVRTKEAGIPSGQGKYKKEGWTVYTQAGAIDGFDWVWRRLEGNTGQ